MLFQHSFTHKLVGTHKISQATLRPEYQIQSHGTHTRITVPVPAFREQIHNNQALRLSSEVITIHIEIFEISSVSEYVRGESRARQTDERKKSSRKHHLTHRPSDKD